MKATKDRISDFQTMIFSWWEDHRRDLPWRRTRDPYKILVSEVMLQQTQVSRVLPRYAQFIEAYPTVKALSQASPADILRIWKGMGYNRRALYVLKAAKVIVGHYNNQFPVSEQLLTKLPGLGTYTARAILVFAFEKNIAMVDTNIRRIIAHFFFHGKPQKEKTIQDIADQLLPYGKSWAWHQALMDYGAIEMSKGKSLPAGKAGQKSKLKKKTTTFKNSTRYFRGRVVDALREGAKTEDELKSIASDTIIASLVKDGLVVRRGGVFTLPE